MKKREIRKIKKQLLYTDNKTMETFRLLNCIKEKDEYIIFLKGHIDGLNNQIENMLRNVQNGYISKLTIVRLIAELEPKQKFREIAILKELLYKRS